MPAWAIDEDRALRQVAEVENALFDGAPPFPHIGSHQKGAIRLAAERMGMCDQTLRRRVGTPEHVGAIERRYGFRVDWAMYRPPAPAELPPLAELRAGVGKPSAASEDDDARAPPSDPIDLRRLRDENTRLRTALRDAERRAAEAEDIRAGVLGLTADPLRPQLSLPAARGDLAVSGRTVVLHLSDIHFGETVDIQEMDGLNRYDAEIAKQRLGRFFSRAADLMSKHWKGDPPDEIVLCLGGDLISGNLHPELEQTNAPAVPATVRDVGEHIAGGIILLRKEIKRPIRVYSVPGNHGRITPKPQSKGRSAGSLDLLATDFCEAVTRGAAVKDVSFYKASSPDAYFSTYGFHWLVTHGDAAGYRGGGVGFIGPMATIVKAHRKLVDVAWRSGKPVHYVLTAHHHTTGKTAFGWSNGSVIGYGEFARDLRADPEGSRQNMLIVHPRHGVIDHMELHLGAPDEGSLYAGPATVIRPQWGAE